ncbi:G2-specific serine/threonine protein kinase [Lithohypha guttulata]|uniref:G2-specific serine/threonine protein kinase n=1 Tax=Lithohypha guttulata TaxID=1690604 RepID=UPI002DE12200|nr:G2-specific serine/threonine protein kinase [Lithohypha guttulata]
METQEQHLITLADNLPNLDLSPVEIDNDPKPGMALAVCYQMGLQPVLLVRPAFAYGAYGVCSVWLGANDKKLYLRKMVLECAGMTATPSDIVHYVPHLNVPKLVHYVNHEAGPEPRLSDDMFEGMKQQHLWSMFSEFINGPTLEKVIKQYANKQMYIPETEIWRVGAALLSVVMKMQYPMGHGYQTEAKLHRDIRPRNILVSNSPESTQTTFHLIDFGIAAGPDMMRRMLPGNFDVCMIAEVLFGMMLHKADPNPRQCCNFDNDVFSLSKRLPDWPYSEELYSSISELHKYEHKSKTPLQPKPQLRQWMKKFQTFATSSLEQATSDGKSIRLESVAPLPDTKPMLFKHSEADEVIADLKLRNTTPVVLSRKRGSMKPA